MVTPQIKNNIKEETSRPQKVLLASPVLPTIGPECDPLHCPVCTRACPLRGAPTGGRRRRPRPPRQVGRALAGRPRSLLLARGRAGLAGLGSGCGAAPGQEAESSSAAAAAAGLCLYRSPAQAAEPGPPRADTVGRRARTAGAEVSPAGAGRGGRRAALPGETPLPGTLRAPEPSSRTPAPDSDPGAPPPPAARPEPPCSGPRPVSCSRDPTPLPSREVRPCCPAPLSLPHPIPRVPAFPHASDAPFFPGCTLGCAPRGACSGWPAGSGRAFPEPRAAGAAVRAGAGQPCAPREPGAHRVPSHRGLDP
nr:translation initiation factor IF-2-like [Equus asinus]